MPPAADHAETLRVALERFAAGDAEQADALLAPDVVYCGHPLFHRDGEDERFHTLGARLASFEEHGITANARVIGVEQVGPAAFVATMALHTETAEHEGFSMLAGSFISFDDAGRIDHIHTHDTPAAARAAAAEGCCEAHRLQVARRAGASNAA